MEGTRQVRIREGGRGGSQRALSAIVKRLMICKAGCKQCGVWLFDREGDVEGWAVEAGGPLGGSVASGLRPDT